MTQIDQPSSNISQISVSELSAALKRTLEDRFGYVRVRGEISGYRGPHSSGHAYFSLKDESARLDAVVWRTTFARMKIKPEEGMEVIASGKVTTFAGKSSYQIVVETLEPAGAGALMLLLEKRRRQLAAEGFFDVSRKRKLPFLPRVIGIITSPGGAVIRDILHRLSDRFPVHVIVWPVRVQGEGAAEELRGAVNGFSALSETSQIVRPDLVIVARGGGSLEDLWSFNDEFLVRSVAESSIPIISAIGHETDWTLIDHVSDLRAPTPTAAAEIAVPVRADLIAHVSQFEARAIAAVTRNNQQFSTNLRVVSRSIPSLTNVVVFKSQRLDAVADRLRSLLDTKSSADRLKLALVDARLNRMSPEARFEMKRDTTKFLAARLKSSTMRAREGCVLQRDRIANALPFSAFRYFERRAEQSRAILRQWELKSAGNRLQLVSLQRALEHNVQSLNRAMGDGFEQKGASSIKAGRLFAVVNYRSVLARGYALVLNEEKRVITKARELRTTQKFIIRLADGDVAAVTEPMRPKKKRATGTKDSYQKALF